jgi:hypothetical protein
MTVEGHVENGQIVLHGDVQLADGMKVRIELLQTSAEKQQAAAAGTQFEHYKSFIGSIDDLPSDFAAQHDHYIHGTPKR